jgi:hypothetical protein
VEASLRPRRIYGEQAEVGCMPLSHTRSEKRGLPGWRWNRTIRSRQGSLSGNYKRLFDLRRLSESSEKIQVEQLLPHHVQKHSKVAGKHQSNS